LHVVVPYLVAVDVGFNIIGAAKLGLICVVVGLFNASEKSQAVQLTL
jgi:hypothetical protein